MRIILSIRRGGVKKAGSALCVSGDINTGNWFLGAGVGNRKSIEKRMLRRDKRSSSWQPGLGTRGALGTCMVETLRGSFLLKAISKGSKSRERSTRLDTMSRGSITPKTEQTGLMN